MFKYWGFGLNIEAEIEFPELLPTDFTMADVTVALGDTPGQLEGKGIIIKPLSSISSNEYLLNVKGICKYYAGFGKTIIVEPVPGTELESVRLFLLGTVMAAILYQKGLIPLHASAIVKDGKLILFAGNSGAGKSTLLASLATKGYTVFTDDICVVSRGARGISGTASYPMLKLWEDAITQLENEAFTKDFKVRPKLPKYGQFFYDAFSKETLPIDKIFILAPNNNAAEIKIRKLPPLQAFKDLEKQAYKYNLIANTQLRTVLFTLLSQVTAGIPVYEVKRPVKGTNVDLLCEAIQPLF